MFIELVDSLRCVEAHEDTWLVASFDRLDDRRIVEGSLGCPICRASYRVIDGVCWLGADSASTLPDESSSAHVLPNQDEEHEALRLAALLDLTEPGMRAVVGGTLGRVAAALAALTQSELLLIDPPASVAPGPGVSIVRTGGRLPLAAGSMRAIALDERTQHALLPAVATLRDGGRLVAPAGAPLPASVTELARDARQWVATRDARPSAPVPLRIMRSARPTG